MNRKEKALEYLDVGYNINVTGRHILVTDSMKAYALEKISKIERFMNRIIDVNVLMDIQKLDHQVEIIMRAGNFKIISSASTTDMYASIDKAVDKLEAQILRYKSKIQDHHAKGRAVVDMTVNVIRRPLDGEDLEFDEEFEALEVGKPHAVVKQETRPSKY